MKNIVHTKILYMMRLHNVTKLYSGYITWGELLALEKTDKSVLWRWINRNKWAIVIDNPAPYARKCPYCSWYFKGRRELSGHLPSGHPGKTLPDCGRCGVLITDENKARMTGGGKLCDACVRVARREWTTRPAYMEARRVKQRQKYRALRQRVLHAYGGKCNCCGESQPEFLSIDHINNDGKEHRKSLRGLRIYHWLESKGYPKDNFQLLCFNCNYVKNIHGECPHKRQNMFRRNE